MDEKALYEALTQRVIAGAALDVWYLIAENIHRAAQGEPPVNLITSSE